MIRHANMRDALLEGPVTSRRGSRPGAGMCEPVRALGTPGDWNKKWVELIDPSCCRPRLVRSGREGNEIGARWTNNADRDGGDCHCCLGHCRDVRIGGTLWLTNADLGLQRRDHRMLLVDVQCETTLQRMHDSDFQLRNFPDRLSVRNRSGSGVGSDWNDVRTDNKADSQEVVDRSRNFCFRPVAHRMDGGLHTHPVVHSGRNDALSAIYQNCSDLADRRTVASIEPDGRRSPARPRRPDASSCWALLISLGRPFGVLSLKGRLEKPAVIPIDATSARFVPNALKLIATRFELAVLPARHSGLGHAGDLSHQGLRHAENLLSNMLDGSHDA